MAFFDENELSSVGSIHIEAAEGYSGAIGAQLALIEGYQNDFAMFTAAIRTDIKEAKMIRESASEDEIGAMQEGALSNFWEKIKEFVKKIIAKIKSIFHGFIAKFEAWMGKNGKAFFDKYKKEIYGKDISKLKVNYSKANVDPDGITVDIGKCTLLKDEPREREKSEYVEGYLKDMMTPTVSNPDTSSFRKEFHEACFDTEEKGYECNTGSVDEYVKFISGKKSPVEAVKKMASEQEKVLNAVLRRVETFQKQLTNHLIDKDDEDKGKYDAVGGHFTKDVGATNKPANGIFGKGEDEQKRAALYSKQVTAMQEALSLGNSAALTEIKFGVAQSRRIAAAIVAHNPKKHEDVDLVMMEQEVAEYDVLSELEAVC